MKLKKKMKVPLLDLKLQYNELQSELEEAILKVAQSQMLILGDEVAKLEKSVAEYLGCKYTVGVSSGTDALLMALMALDLQPGDEVILPDYSFFATAGAVVRAGGKPVFVDCDPVTFNIIPEKIEEAITANTRAIIPVHLYGQAADMQAIMAIAEENFIPVIEDAAQSIGATYNNGQAVGTFGMCGCFSFYPTKNLGAFGDGGMITTNDETMYKKFIQMRNHGMEPKYHHKFIGGNFRLDAIQAAVLNVKLPHLESWNKQRQINADIYTNSFIGKGLAHDTGITKFDNVNKVLLPKAVYKYDSNKNYHTYNQYIIRVEKRDELRAYLAENGIGSEIYYPVPFHEQECFSYLNANEANFPNSIFAAKHSLALPIFPELKVEQILYVVDTIANFMNK